MSHSTITVGLNENAKASSRIQRGAPSNGHTNIFGDDLEAPQQRTGRRRIPDCNASVESSPPMQQPEGKQEAPQQTKQAEERAHPVKPEANQPEAAKERVRVPPGGFSTGFW